MLADRTNTERPASMAAVAECVRGLDPARNMDDVAERLREIARERGSVRRGFRRRPDGVACFNYMYLRVTETVRDSLDEFEDPVFVERLAVVFAEFYLVAYDAARSGGWVSKAWEPLFEASRRHGIAPIQYALAGMNAHINNDLAWALLQTWSELGYAQAPESPVYRDFERINRLLDAVGVEVRATLETGCLRRLDHLLGRLDDLVEGFVVAKARAEAWERGTRWRAHFDLAAAAAHDRHVGFDTHLILAL